MPTSAVDLNCRRSNLIIGPRGSAAEKVFANSLTNNKNGFTSLPAVIAPNLVVKPATVMSNKVTIKDAKRRCKAHVKLHMGGQS
jgi:formaldehyde-activating enzyme